MSGEDGGTGEDCPDVDHDSFPRLERVRRTGARISRISRYESVTTCSVFPCLPPSELRRVTLLVNTSDLIRVRRGQICMLSMKLFVILTLFCSAARTQRYQDEYNKLFATVEDRSGLEAIRNLHQQLDDDNDGTIEPDETVDFIKADLQVQLIVKNIIGTTNWLHVVHSLIIKFN